MLAYKARLVIGLGAINFFPHTSHKRPSTGLTNDRWHPGIVAIVRLVHFGGRMFNESNDPIWQGENRVGPKSNVSALPPKADMCSALANVG